MREFFFLARAAELPIAFRRSVVHIHHELSDRSKYFIANYSAIYNLYIELTIFKNPLEVAFPQIGAPICTLYDNFQRGLYLARDKPCMGTRRREINVDSKLTFYEYQWMTYEEVSEARFLLGSALMHLNQTLLLNQKETQWTVGIYSINRPEWLITELAANSYSLISVALCKQLDYPNLLLYID